MLHFVRSVSLCIAFSFALPVGSAIGQPVITDLAGFTTLLNPLCADFRVLGSCSCTEVIQADQVCQRGPGHMRLSPENSVAIFIRGGEICLMRYCWLMRF
jgi:hypothetical protein